MQKCLQELEIQGRFEVTQMTALVKSAKILRRLQYWENFLSFDFWWKPTRYCQCKNNDHKIIFFCIFFVAKQLLYCPFLVFACKYLVSVCLQHFWRNLRLREICICIYRIVIQLHFKRNIFWMNPNHLVNIINCFLKIYYNLMQACLFTHVFVFCTHHFMLWQAIKQGWNL